MPKTIILFVCIGNSGRSQMAEAFLKRIAGSTMNVMSAGINPDEKVHPKTIETMKKVGISVEQAKPKRLTTEMVKQADRIVVMDSKVL